MTDDIGLIYNLGSDGEAVSFKESSNTRNNVAVILPLEKSWYACLI